MVPSNFEREPGVESFNNSLQYGGKQDDKAPEYEEMHPPRQRVTQQPGLPEGNRQDILQPGADGIEAVFFPADPERNRISRRQL